MAETEVFDNNGNRLYPVTICTICPLEIDEAGRQVCFEYWNLCEDYPGHTVDSMLTDILGPVGSDSETHSFCAREGYTHQERMLKGFIAGKSGSNPLFGERFATIDDTPEEIKSKLYVFVGSSADLLAHLGLEVKRVR